MQIGALGWASDTGKAGFGYVFDGTISDVYVVEGVHGTDEIAGLIASASAGDEMVFASRTADSPQDVLLLTDPVEPGLTAPLSDPALVEPTPEQQTETFGADDFLFA